MNSECYTNLGVQCLCTGRNPHVAYNLNVDGNLMLFIFGKANYEDIRFVNYPSTIITLPVDYKTSDWFFLHNCIKVTDEHYQWLPKETYFLSNIRC